MVSLFFWGQWKIVPSIVFGFDLNTFKYIAYRISRQWNLFSFLAECGGAVMGWDHLVGDREGAIG